FLEMGTHVYRLSKISENIKSSPSKYGLTLLAFSTILESYLYFLRGCVVSLPAILMWEDMDLNSRRENPRILQLYFGIDVLRFVVFWLAEFCGCAMGDIYSLDNVKLPRGASFLTSVYDALSSFDFMAEAEEKDAAICAVLRAVLESCLWPYLSWLKNWCCGVKELEDPFDEFLVGWSGDGEYWKEGFQIRANNAPTFIGDKLAANLVQGGKAIRLIWSCVPDHPVFKVLFDNEYEAGIDVATSDGDVELIQKKILQYKILFNENYENYLTDHSLNLTSNINLNQINVSEFESRAQKFARERKEQKKKEAEEKRQEKEKLQSEILKFLETNRLEKETTTLEQQKAESLLSQVLNELELRKEKVLQEEVQKLENDFTSKLEKLSEMETKLDWRMKRLQLADKRKFFYEISKNWKPLDERKEKIHFFKADFGNIDENNVSKASKTSDNNLVDVDEPKALSYNFDFTDGIIDEISVIFDIDEVPLSSSLTSNQIEASNEIVKIEDLKVQTEHGNDLNVSTVLLNELKTEIRNHENDENFVSLLPKPEILQENHFDYSSVTRIFNNDSFFEGFTHEITRLGELKTHLGAKKVDKHLKHRASKYSGRSVAMGFDFSKSREPRNPGHTTALIFQETLQRSLYQHSRLLNNFSVAFILGGSKFIKDGATIMLLPLEAHLKVLYDFVLLGDGTFVTLLCDALFTGSRRPCALGLNGRVGWPPSVAELSNALKDVTVTRLEDKVYSSIEDVKDRLMFVGDPEECRVTDPSSIEALGFLTLRYVPPSPMNVILTPSILSKLEVIFAFSLKLQRINEVLNHLHHLPLFREVPSPKTAPAFRLRHQAKALIAALLQYSRDIAIDQPWGQFLQVLGRVVELTNPNLQSSPSPESEYESDAHTVTDLHMLHRLIHCVVDRIQWRLFLRPKQSRMAGLLEGVFQLVLMASRLLITNNVAAVGKIYAKFAILLAALVQSLKLNVAREGADAAALAKVGVSFFSGAEKEGSAGFVSEVAKEHACFAQLLILLDAEGFIEKEIVGNVSKWQQNL
ncbi:hypothetical protein HK096_001502, partial [Nowakowskiella sp. JEL0078]